MQAISKRLSESQLSVLPSRILDQLGDRIEALIQETQATAAMLVGSFAVGRSNLRSDLDIALVPADETGHRTMQERLDGLRLDIEFVSKTWLSGLTNHPLVSLSGLRVARRLANGILLHSEWPALENILRCALSLSLDPLESSVLIERIELSLQESETVSSDHHSCALALQTAALSLMILASTTTPHSFQKIKWLAGDLRASSYSVLVDDLMFLTYGNAVDDEPSVAGMVRNVTGYLRSSLNTIEEVSRRERMLPEQVALFMDTAKDASMLSETGDLEGSTIASHFALRQMAAIRAGEQSRLGRLGQVSSLPLEHTFTPESPQNKDEIDRTRESLRLSLNNLRLRFRDRYARLFPENSFSIDGSRVGVSALLGVTRIDRNLWIGSCPTRSRDLMRLDISKLILLSPRCRLGDECDFDGDIVRIPLEEKYISDKQLGSVVSAAEEATAVLRRGNSSVLVSCDYGLDRSAMIGALALSMHRGLGATASIERIRTCIPGALRRRHHCDRIRQVIGSS